MSVGITEGYEPSIKFNWINSTCDMNIIITKNLTKVMFAPLIEMKRNTILHVTCTGLGKTYEPGAPSVNETICAVEDIIDFGFPPQQIVMRIDPIIPVANGLTVVKDIVRKVKTSDSINQITRFRYSFLDNYKHLAYRFFKQALEMPKSHNGAFNATEQYVSHALKVLCALEDEYDIELETCGEGYYLIIPKRHRIGCVSKKDCRILGLDEGIVLTGRNTQGRHHCLCEAKKTELIPVHKPCEINCVYCFMKKVSENT